MRLAISKRKHIPVFRVEGVEWSFPFWKYKQAKFIENTGLHLDGVGVSMLLYELQYGLYLPPFSLSGMTVLDLGACCGETAWYFLKHGAEKVVAVECDDKRIAYLKDNVSRLNLNVDVYGEPFKLEHLGLDYDFIKCDVEGYEMLLLESKRELKPCILEVHTYWVREQFLKAGFKDVHTFRRHAFLGLMSNYESTGENEI